MERKLAKTLLFMRNTPCVKTGTAPAALMLKQSPRTKLSMLRPEMNAKICPSVKSKGISSFEAGQPVFVRATQGKIVKWWPGEVIARKSPATYWIRVNGKDRLYHVDEIKDNATDSQPQRDRDGPDVASTSKEDGFLAEALLPNEVEHYNRTTGAHSGNEAPSNDPATMIDPEPAPAMELIVRRSVRPSKPPQRYVP